MALLNIRYDFRCPDISPVPVDELYEAAIEQVVWAENLGFVSVTLSEHHGSDDGYLPSLVALASAMAARTENIHIMLAALIAPMHDPLRAAEDLAVLDRISKGRISVVVAGGYVPSEFEMFGHTTGDRVRLTVEMVETLKAAWTGEPFEFRGRTVRVTPTPYQDPRPAIWLGGSGEKAARPGGPHRRRVPAHHARVLGLLPRRGHQARPARPRPGHLWRRRLPAHHPRPRRHLGQSRPPRPARDERLRPVGGRVGRRHRLRASQRRRRTPSHRACTNSSPPPRPSR